jgi:two-component system sensor histidine kinase BaeS
VIVAHGFDISGQLAGAVVLAKPVASLQSWVPLARWFLIAGIGSLAVSLVFAFILARRLSQPLHEITLAASAVAAGDFSRELGVRSQDEIGRLADAFRYMSDEVQKSQEQQRQFVINVSHELKTPLTSIAGHAQALKDGVAAEPADVKRSLEVIDAETRRLSRLIEDLLSLAKFDARQFELKRATVSLPQMLTSLADGFSMQAREEGPALEVDTSADISITTDPDRLRQIMANLVQNALAHTPAGGRVRVAARAAGEEGVVIEVSDNGRGISPEDLPHVFDRFYRVSQGAPEAGLGLGLSISRELARALGGDITVASTPGEGSSFSVSLPS